MNHDNFFTTNRRRFLQAGLAGTAMVGLPERSMSASKTGNPRKVGTGAPQIFVDLDRVEILDNVQQLFHQAQKNPENPVLYGERPWEASGYGFVTSVVYDEEEKLFKCWYQGAIGCVAGPVHTHGPHVLCYATSTDGIHWERPVLGLHEFEGSKENNIVVPQSYHNGKDHWESVLKDSFDADEQARYKGFGWSSETGGLHTMTSPDGLRWKHSPGVVVPGGDAHAMMIDRLKRRYVLFVRGGDPTGVHYSSDFVNWSDRDNGAIRWPGPGSCYNQVGFVYGDSYLGIVSYYQPHNDYLMDARLLSSRDGLHYELPGPDPLTRPALVQMGQIGDWDRLQTRLTGGPPVVVGDKLYLYYRGFSTSHDKGNPPKDHYYAGAMGLATLRRDGFASLAAGFDGGSVTTRPVKFEGSNAVLRLNAKADHHARVEVEVLDAQGKALGDYAGDAVIPVKGDGVNLSATWKNRKSIGELAGRSIRLRFKLTNARLYSYTIT